jgi:hypothetical protein
MVTDISEECVASVFMKEEFCPEDGCSTFLRNISSNLAGCTVSHPKRQ